MGKYMKKSKIAGGVVTMEVPQSTMGVCTRARTLALQRLQSSSSAGGSDDLSVLQLRSRRLHKRAKLDHLAKLIAEGKLKVKIDSKHPLSQAEDAWTKSIEGHATGKIIVEP